MASDFRVLAYCLTLGPLFFYQGFRKLKQRQRAKALATSKARSIAMGTVEISGIAAPHVDIRDPIYQRPCAYYNIKVEKRRRSGKSSHWATIHTDTSNGKAFYCRDATGKVLVLPDSPELHFTKPITARNSLFSTNAADPARVYLSRWDGVFSNVRLTAHIIREGEPLYILGCAVPASSAKATTARQDGPKISRSEIAARLKRDTERMKRMDTNEDGSLDQMEWEQGLAEYEAFIREKSKASSAPGRPATATDDTPVFSGVVTRSGDVDLIFAHTENDFVGKLGWQSFLFVAGGGAAIVVGLVLLLQKLS